MRDLELICPECKSGLISNNTQLSCSNNHTFYIKNGVFNLLPKSLDEVTCNDAYYHAAQKETWVEQNQIDAQRNLFFHKRIVKFISTRSNEKSNILEIGGGVGFDLELFLNTKVAFSNYIFSEISNEMLSYVSERINNNIITYCCIDAKNIPFKKNQFDFVYMIAAFHHFTDTHKALEEMIRITRNGGYILFGIEPNKRWFRLVSVMKGFFRKILPQKRHSPADEKTEGFTANDFKEMGESWGLKLIKLESVWFFCGFIHYGLEFLYRMFHLKKRVRLPLFLEKIFIYLDKCLFIFPGIKNLCWHYTAIYQKN
ncbi:MAG: class I SAM-dependent methyltransferase [Elusimicrobia bacterium]|nr:class I SAM-dependent methyltransferase [Elusimicrobiota bacterium]